MSQQFIGLERSPFLGSLYEGYIAGEIVKAQVNVARRKELYFFRDQQGLQVDFMLPRPNATSWLIEAKSTRAPRPEMARPMLSLASSAPSVKRSILVHREPASGIITSALSPGAEALTDTAFFDLLRD